MNEPILPASLACDAEIGTSALPYAPVRTEPTSRRRPVAPHRQAGPHAAQAGSVDVSFNLISRGDVQGTRLWT
jgi:hypothetical protein